MRKIGRVTEAQNLQNFDFFSIRSCTVNRESELLNRLNLYKDRLACPVPTGQSAEAQSLPARVPGRYTYRIAAAHPLLALTLPCLDIFSSGLSSAGP